MFFVLGQCCQEGSLEFPRLRQSHVQVDRIQLAVIEPGHRLAIDRPADDGNVLNHLYGRFLVLSRGIRRTEQPGHHEQAKRDGSHGLNPMLLLHQSGEAERPSSAAAGAE